MAPIGSTAAIAALHAATTAVAAAPAFAATAVRVANSAVRTARAAFNTNGTLEVTEHTSIHIGTTYKIKDITENGKVFYIKGNNTDDTLKGVVIKGEILQTNGHLSLSAALLSAGWGFDPEKCDFNQAIVLNLTFGGKRGEAVREQIKGAHQRRHPNKNVDNGIFTIPDVTRLLTGFKEKGAEITDDELHISLLALSELRKLLTTPGISTDHTEVETCKGKIGEFNAAMSAVGKNLVDIAVEKGLPNAKEMISSVLGKADHDHADAGAPPPGAYSAASAAAASAKPEPTFEPKPASAAPDPSRGEGGRGRRGRGR